MRTLPRRLSPDARLQFFSLNFVGAQITLLCAVVFLADASIR